jgi:GT2 family glycosyltransferase
LSTTAPHTRHTVTALIVAHDGAQLLPALVKALNAQTYQVERTVGVDTGSRDRSGAVLGELIGQDAVFGVNRSTGYGEAVEVGLRHATRLGTVTTDPGVTRVEWIWLLHDDCEPAPDALEKLLRAASRDRSVVVVGPKVLDAQDRRTLREVGVSIDRAGRRVTGIDPGEIDQGQHDHNRAVLAVGSAGMLVRRDVWERLGGFDPALKFFRDDVDFCWRVQAVGLRVQVVTDAVLYHRELGARRRRPVDGGKARRLDRRNALFVLAVNLPLLTMLRVVGGSIVGSLFRAGYFLLTKQLDLAAAYAFSVLGLFAHPIKLIKGRSRRAAGIAEGYYAVRVFIPPARTLFRLAEKIAGLVSNGPPQASYGRHQATVEESEEDEQFVDQSSVVRRIIGHPGVQLFIALLIIALVAERRLLAATPLGGGALVPAWGGAAALWQEYLAGFHAVSVGSTASAPPYLAVVAALGTVLGGQAWLAVDVLLLGCVPLAGLTAYLATRWLVSSTAARVLLAASYALLPVATGAVAAGRLGTAVAFALLPLIAVSAGRMLTAAPRQARRAAWATGVLIAVAAAFAPLTWVVGLVFAVAAVAARRWLVAVHPLNAAIVVATPFFVLFPWSLHLLTSPSAFLTEAGVSTSALTTRGLSPTALLALSPGGPGLPPVWVTVGLGLALLALVLPVRRTTLVIAGWSVAIAGILFAVLVSRVTVTSVAGGQSAAGWPGVAMALAALGLLLASAPASQWLVHIIQNDGGRLPTATSSPAPLHGRSRRLLACVALAAAATAPLLVAGYWLKGGVRGPVGSISAPLLPAFVSAGAASGEQYRTLILRPDGAGLDYMVVRQGDPTLGEPELGVASTAGSALSRQVAALGAPNGADAGDPGLVLGSFGIRWVLLPAPVNPVLAQRLDASLGLVALNKGSSYDLWQVTGAVGRARVVAVDGATSELSSGTVNLTGVSAPANGGTLILAEPYGGWTATLNGQALKPVATPVNGWAQGFALPAGGGRLSITRDNLARTVSLVLELIATLAVILLALPGKRADPVQEAEALTALREARDGKRAASSARRAMRERVGGTGHRAVGGVDLRGFARKRRPGQAPADAEPAGDEVFAGEPAENQAQPEDQGSTEQVPVTAAVGDAEPARHGAAATVGLADRGQGRHRGRAEDDRRGAHLPGQRASTPESPVSGTRVPGTRAPRDTGPQRPPWETGPETGPQGPSTGVQPRYPWDSGPQQPVAPTGSQSAARTGSHPVSRTGAQPAPGTGPQRISWTGPQPVAGSGAGPVAPTGTQPVAPTGAQPTTRTGSQPTTRTGSQPAARTGSHPVSRTDAQPAPGTGPQRVSWARPEPLPGTGGPPVSRTGPQRGPQQGPQHGPETVNQPGERAPWDPDEQSGERAPWEPDEQPVERAPWESDSWDENLGSRPGRRDPSGEAPEPGSTPSGTGASPAMARPARQERGAHRAAKHGKPSRWRGNRSTGGES